MIKHKWLSKKITLSNPRGNASEKSIRGKLNVPKEIITDMGIDKETELVIIYDDEKKEFLVRKETTEDMFI